IGGSTGSTVNSVGGVESALVNLAKTTWSNRGAMRGPIRREILAIVLFDQISDEQVTWMVRNECLLTCKGVFVRGVVMIAGAGPVLQMMDVSSESRTGGGAATPVVAAP